MVGGTPTVDLPQVVRARIEARTGNVVFVVPDLRISPETAIVDLYPPSRGHPKSVSLYEVEPATRLLVSVEERGDQRP